MKKYAFAGASSRVIYGMYLNAFANEYSDAAEIVGIFDTNRKRSEIFKKMAGKDFPVYSNFQEMLMQAKPDVVVVTTVDGYHHEYIIQALEAGCDVISEKPITTDAEKCNAILDTEKRTGRRIFVTFNLRFAPFFARIKELIKTGSIGEIYSVHFEWFLDTYHGADYFRRWHRRKENSGGLLVHKSTHHFDLINWFLEDEPDTVSAFGTRNYYGSTRDKRGTRCRTCLYRDTCEFFFDISSFEMTRELYLQCEDADGYIRDGCVFSDEIDIEDTASLNVKYSQGALMSYSLTAHSPYEGCRLSLNGSEGRLEAEDFHGSIGPYAGERVYRLRLYNRKGEETAIKFPKVEGGHGGGDERLIKMIIKGDLPDPLGQMADSRAGIMSAIIGIAANESIKNNKFIRIKDLLS